MPRPNHPPTPPSQRMTSYRERMRAAGLRPVQIWVPDTRAPDFIAKCRKQARAVAQRDAAGDDLMTFIDQTYEWPDE